MKCRCGRASGTGRRPRASADRAVVPGSGTASGSAPRTGLAVAVGEQVAAGGGPGVGVLHVVEAVVVGLPDLEPRAGDRRAVGVA